MATEQVIEFIPLSQYPDYEILSQYPFTIRRKDNHYEIKERINKSNCYPSVCINGNKINKHQIIAQQFIPNPDNLKFIDHINKDRTDYHLENLRWCTLSDNNKNATSRNGVKYVFLNEIRTSIISYRDLIKEYNEIGEVFDVYIDELTGDYNDYGCPYHFPRKFNNEIELFLNTLMRARNVWKSLIPIMVK